MLSMQTDLLGTLEVASDFFGKTPERDYHAKPPGSKAEAESLGVPDLTWAKTQYKLEPDAWNNAKVLLWFPNTSMEASHAAEMKYYWNALFSD